MGIASFFLSILTISLALIVLVLLLIGAVSEGKTTGPLTILLGVGILSSPVILPLMYLVTFGLGVAGVIQRRRKRLFAILGTILSGLVLAGMFLILLVVIIVKLTS